MATDRKLIEESLRLKKLLDNAWLVDENVKFDDDLFSIGALPDETLLHRTLRVMMDPENFYFTCKHVLNIELLPFQIVVLKEIWRHNRVEFIATRGGGKCITGDSLIMLDDKICRLDSIIPHNAGEQEQINIPNKVYGEQGYQDIAYGWNNGITKTIKIKTQLGITLEGTLDHPIRVVGDNKIEWRNLENLTLGNYVPIDISESWLQKTNDLPEDLAYFFGLIIGDGGYTVRGRVSFTSADAQLHEEVDRLAKKYFGKGFVECGDKYSKNLYGVGIWDSLFQKYGFNSPACSEKAFPASILSASKDAMRWFIRGLMDTDGWVTKERGAVGFGSKSINLVKMLQFVLQRFGIISRYSRKFSKKYQRYYHEINISGEFANKFLQEIGFNLKWKQERLLKRLDVKLNTNTNIAPTPLISNVLPKKYTDNRHNVSLSLARKLFPENETLKLPYYYDKIVSIEYGESQTFDIHVPIGHSFISNGIISHNTFLLAVYAILRALLKQGSKIVIVGAGFRQSKMLFDYCERIWYNSPILRSMSGDPKFAGPKHGTDQWTLVIGESTITALPIGDGEKIRGLRANVTICDEFKSHNPEIFETVIVGFGSVLPNPVEGVKKAARVKKMKDMNLWTQAQQDALDGDNQNNQIILSGTAYYANNHFYKYWKDYCNFIHSRGDKKKIDELFKGRPPRSFSHKDFVIIRLPYDIIPEGYMDDKTVALSQATFTAGNYAVEYGAVFAKDSDGFFRRSLIDACVAPLQFPTGEKINFIATLRGNPHGKYVYAIDPASERDNFSVVILELHETHRRVVYCWTTTRTSHREKIKKKMKEGFEIELDFYCYCVRHTRNLMKVFPCERIMIDSQGGGVAVEEAFHEKDKIEPGEKLIWRVIDPEKEFWTDDMQGQHIIEMVNFSDSAWVSEANHGMKKDFEDKALLFPHYDSISLGLAAEEDGKLNRTYDTLEDCATEIEELKDELTTIVMTPTGNAQRDRWDTPEIKRPDAKKGRMRKDRYSALLMANMGARVMARTLAPPEYEAVGGFSNNLQAAKPGNEFYKNAPEWVRNAYEGGDYSGISIRRG